MMTATIVKEKPRICEEYRIDKERYKELKHFCQQYRTWKYDLKNFNSDIKTAGVHRMEEKHTLIDPTGAKAIKKVEYSEKIRMVEISAQEASPKYWREIVLAVTEGLTYQYMKYQKGLKVDKDTWYNLRARFFWILDKVKK